MKDFDNLRKVYNLNKKGIMSGNFADYSKIISL